METWVDITGKVKAKVSHSSYCDMLIYIYDKETPVGLFDLRGFSFMGGNTEYKVEKAYQSASNHDRGNKITWFKVYKRKEVQPLKRDSKGRFC